MSINDPIWRSLLNCSQAGDKMVKISEISLSLWRKTSKLYPWETKMGGKIVLTFCFFSGLGCRLLNLLLVSSTSRAPPKWGYEDQTTLPRTAIVNTVFTFLLYKQALPWGRGGLKLSLPCQMSSQAEVDSMTPGCKHQWKWKTVWLSNCQHFENSILRTELGI